MEIAGGLVGEQERGRMHNCAGDAHELLLAAGELRRKEIFLGNDLKAVENFGDHALAFFLGQVLVGERQVDVLGDGEVVEEVIALEDHADALAGEVGALLAIERVGGRFAEPVFAEPAVVEKSEHVEQR